MDIVEQGAQPTDQGPQGLAAVGPTMNMGDQQDQLVTVPLTADQCNEWWGRIQAWDDRMKKEMEDWKTLMDAYTPKVSKGGQPEDVNANSHFRNVHTKLGQMFVTVPRVTMEPSPNSPADDQRPGPPDPMTGQPSVLTMADVVSVKQEYLNKKLGRDGIRVSRLFDQIIFDQLAWAGIGCSKLGYRCVTKMVPQPVMQPDPNFVPPMQPGAVMGLAPTPQPPQVPVLDPMTQQPMTRNIPVTVYEEIYWRRFSPMKYVGDALCYSTDYDNDATMQGMRFSMLPSQAAQAFQIPEEELRGQEDEYRYKTKNDTPPKVNPITGVELFYKACYYMENEFHPWKLMQLVFLDSIKDRPVVHRPCPDQTFTPEGELSEDSLDRFPIRVCTIRDFADSSLPPSDSAFTQNLAKQLNTTRQQGVALRDAAIGKVLFDGGKLEDGDVAKVRNARPGDWIEVAEGALDRGKDAVATTISQPVRTNDDYRLDAMLQKNMDETLGISANSSGATEDTVRSATEIDAVQRAVQGRNKKERDRVIDHFLDGVRLIDILIMRYTTQKQWAKITGQDGMQRLQAWNGAIVKGRWLYDIAPDSQLEMDTAQDRQQSLNLYNQVKGDPLVNRAPVLQRLFRSYGYDPSRCVYTPQQMAAMAMQPQHADAQTNQHEATKTGGRQNAPGAGPNPREPGQT